MKNRYRGRDYLKKGGAWVVCRFKGGLGKKMGGVFFRGSWYPDAHYECSGKIKFLRKYQKFSWTNNGIFSVIFEYIKDN